MVTLLILPFALPRCLLVIARLSASGLRSRRDERDALSSAGVPHTVEIWPGRHGFAVPDMPVHDAAVEDRHWDTLATLYGEHLANA